jgi:hypothetical protein
MPQGAKIDEGKGREESHDPRFRCNGMGGGGGWGGGVKPLPRPQKIVIFFNFSRSIIYMNI